MALNLTLNGKSRSFEGLTSGANLGQLVALLGFQSDRVALELNGAIVSRTSWEQTSLDEGDRLEMVHFVGGG